MADVEQVDIVDGLPTTGTGTVDTLVRTNAKLDTLIISSRGDTSVQTNATGSSWQAFGSQACKQLSIVNDTGTKLLVRSVGGGAHGTPLPDGFGMTLKGITNTDDIEVKRADSSNTQVTLYGFWEA